MTLLLLAEMLNLIIDPRLLAAPDHTADAGQLRSFVALLMDLGELSRCPRLGLFLSERVADCLQSDGCYPLPAAMSALLRSRGVDEYDLNTIKHVLTRILSLRSIENLTGIREVLYDQFVCNPTSLIGERLPASTREAARTLVFMALCESISITAIRCGAMVTQILPRSEGIRISASVHDAEHDHPVHPFAASHPFTVHAEFLGVTNQHDLFASLNPTSMLSGHFTVEELRFAIRVAVFQNRISRGLDTTMLDDPKFEVTKHFVESVRSRCADDAQLARFTLNAIIAVVDSTNERRCHSLRVGPGPEDAQLVVQGWRAMRHDVTTEHHLHYWKKGDLPVEFASLAFPHADMSIPDPSR